MTLTAIDIEAARNGQPVRFTDPASETDFVLIRADVYDKVRAVLDDGLDESQVARLIEENMRQYDDDDPLLATYQDRR
jgi:hypothetical protein